MTSTETGTSWQLERLSWRQQWQLSEVTFHCPQPLGLYPSHECAGGEVAFVFGANTHHFKLDAMADWLRNTWSVALSDFAKTVTISLDSGSTQAQVVLQQLPLSTLLEMAAVLPAAGPQPDAQLTGGLLLDWQQQHVTTASPVVFQGLSYEHSDDVVLAELSGQLSAALDWPTSDLNFTIQLDGGEMLFDQLYVDFNAFPVTIEGQIKPVSRGWYAVNLSLENPQSMHLSLAVELNQALAWRQPELQLQVFDSHHFNQQITGSILGIYGFGGSEMSGQFNISATSEQGEFDHWQMVFDDYYFLNERRKMAANALTGEVQWRAQGTAADSTLQWQELLLTGLPIGEAAATFNFSADRIHLLGPHAFPVFDGAIELQELRAEKLFSEFIDMDIQAKVLPISLRLITEKMGWPVMSGSISGDIPGMVKRDSVIEFLGALQLQVFGGEMEVANLAMERLFGVAPVIAGDVTFAGFDLSVLTETFGFGLITGRLHGSVMGLRVTNWKTDRLDAQVYTVKTKGVKQIISQRAIENISSLGGIKGAISNTFLRFFDDFRYRKIKLSCRLHNSVCLIGGLKNQGNQFVIVEGGGIPKINIVGFVRAINWEEFISRLLNANYN